jgi:hypothetical protein
MNKRSEIRENTDNDERHRRGSNNSIQTDEFPVENHGKAQIIGTKAGKEERLVFKNWFSGEFAYKKSKNQIDSPDNRRNPHTVRQKKGESY